MLSHSIVHIRFLYWRQVHVLSWWVQNVLLLWISQVTLSNNYIVQFLHTCFKYLKRLRASTCWCNLRFSATLLDFLSPLISIFSLKAVWSFLLVSFFFFHSFIHNYVRMLNIRLSNKKWNYFKRIQHNKHWFISLLYENIFLKSKLIF